jgi:transposase-like protein
MAYLWNVMDRKTRFLIASTLTRHRDVGAADRGFREAKANAHNKLPETVFTDGLTAYRDALKFGLLDAKHVARAGIRVEGENKWLTIIQNAARSKQSPEADGGDSGVKD